MNPNDPRARHEDPSFPPRPTHAWPDRDIAELAGRQRTMITTAQLLGLGVRPRTVGTALSRGRLHRVHRGVHSLVPARAWPRFAIEQAALLAAGPDAVLSHQSAALLHGLRLPTRENAVHVTVPTSHRRGHTDVTVHRTATLLRGEHHRVQGLPATSVARTLLDVSPAYRARQLAPLVDQALRMTSRSKLLDAVDRHPGRPGARRLGRLLDPARPSEDTWSSQEARLRASLRRARLPAPESNVALGPYVADLLWREQRVIVEYDSEAFHTGPAIFVSDRSRRNDLTAVSDHQVIQVTEEHLRNELERVIVWIVLALERGGGW